MMKSIYKAVYSRDVFHLLKFFFFLNNKINFKQKTCEIYSAYSGHKNKITSENIINKTKMFMFGHVLCILFILSNSKKLTVLIITLSSMPEHTPSNWKQSISLKISELGQSSTHKCVKESHLQCDI